MAFAIGTMLKHTHSPHTHCNKKHSGYAIKHGETFATGYGKPPPAQKKAKSRPRNSLSKKSCRIRLTRKKHKELPRCRQNTNNRIWNFNRHLPFSD